MKYLGRRSGASWSWSGSAPARRPATRTTRTGSSAWCTDTSGPAPSARARSASPCAWLSTYTRPMCPSLKYAICPLDWPRALYILQACHAIVHMCSRAYYHHHHYHHSPRLTNELIIITAQGYQTGLLSSTSSSFGALHFP
jgi:hypothetical protein